MKLAKQVMQLGAALHINALCCKRGDWLPPHGGRWTSSTIAPPGLRSGGVCSFSSWVFQLTGKLLFSLYPLTDYWLNSFYEICQKITLFEKSNFCPKIQFWQLPNIFTSFSSKFFLTIFLVKSKLSTAKKSKTKTFSRVLHPKISTIFFENQSWIFGQKMKISNSVICGLFKKSHGKQLPVL